MSTLIQIKRTTTPNLPTANNGNLNLGELAYVYDTSSQSAGAGQNGKRLYIGNPTNPTDIPIKVGGQYYTDMMEHTKGVLTADSAILVDGNKKIDNIKVDNIDIDGNTVTTTSGGLNLSATTNLNLNPSAAVNIKNSYNLPTVDGSAGQVIVTNGSGTTTFADVATNLGIAGDSGTDTISLLTDTLTYAGSSGISTVVDPATNTVTVSGDIATASTVGVASFSSDDFTVTAGGAVSLKLTNLEEHIEDIVANSVDGLIVIEADTGLASVYDDNAGSLTISGVTASTSTKGVASFATADFAVSAGGEVTVKAAGISNAQLAGSIENTKLSNSSTTFSGTTGTTNVSLGSALSVVGGTGTGISTEVTAGTLTISGVTASTSTKGVASFDSGDFSVTSEGVVSIATSGVATTNIANDAVTTAKILDGNVTNAKLANDSVTLGGTALALGATVTSVSGLTSLTSGNVTISTNVLTTSGTNENLILNPNGAGTVDVNSHKITNVSDPTALLDAANKQYVDSVAQGLQVKASVVAATVSNIAGTYDNVAGTITPSSAISTIDGVTVTDGDRILVKDQTTQTENGVYVVGGSGSLLTRATDSTSAADLTAGQFFFIQSGSENGDAGFVQTNIVSTVGSDNIIYTQFSGAGQIIDGAAIGKTGNELFVKVNALDTGGLEIQSDALQIKALGVTNAMLAGSISNDKLVNDSITVNGTEVLLGGSITLDSDDISQGSTNIYYTDALARASLSVTPFTGLSYNNTTGVLAGVIATSTTKGVASFSSDNFTVTNGAVAVTTIDGGSYA